MAFTKWEQELAVFSIADIIHKVREITARAMLFVVISAMATSAFPLLLASTDAAAVGLPAARPNALLSRRQRFAAAKSYCVYFGSGHVAKLACYNVVILHAPTTAHPSWPSMSIRDVHRLNRRGVVTLGYLSVGESTGLLRGDGQGPDGYASWYFNGGNGRPLEDTQWHSFPVNCGSPAWRERILRRAAWLIDQRGFEGLFLDTAEWSLTGVNETSSWFGWSDFLYQFTTGAPTLGSLMVGGYAVNPEVEAKFSQLFQCPSAVLPNTPSGDPTTGNLENAYVQNYSANPNLFLDSNITNTVWGANRNGVPSTFPLNIAHSPVHCIEFADGAQGWPNGFSWFVLDDYYDPAVYTWYAPLQWAPTIPLQGSTLDLTAVVTPLNSFEGNEDSTGGAVNWDYSVRYRHLMTSAQDTGYANAVFADGHVGIINQYALHVYNLVAIER